MGVRLGVDPGDARIGVARSDPTGFLATPLETVRRGQGDVRRIVRLAAETEAVEVVVGLPRSLSGGEGPAAAKVRAWAAALSRALAPLPVRLVDERLTTISAEAMLRDRGVKGRARRAVVDQAAAVVILQQALDTERATGTPPASWSKSRLTGRPAQGHPTTPWRTTMSDRDARPGLDDPAHSDDPSGHEDAYDEAEDDEDYPLEGGRRKRRGRSIPGCLAALVALALIAGGAYVAVTKGAEFIRDQFSTAPDYPGPGRGKVTFEVVAGDTVGQIGRNLKDQGVVQSVDAFIEAAHGESGIQVGFYELKKEMRAADAFDILSNPANIIKNTVTIPEGFQVTQIVARLAKATDHPAKAFQRALANPAKLGLPDYAGGNPEGYLFPSTYDFGPNDKPADMLKKMVDRWRQAADDAGLEEGAAALGHTPAEVMTVASLIEAEGRGEYRAKISRVIYNRLDIDPNPSAGFLQIDASVNYALGRSGSTVITDEDKESVADSPYNLYTHKGLPPTPIEAPGDAAIKAALNPEEGPWFFYVTVNLATGETKFTDSYDEFLQFKDEYTEYCETQSDRC
jgi:UPF0755 protein